MATDALNSQYLTGHTGKALRPCLGSIAECPVSKYEIPSVQPSRQGTEVRNKNVPVPFNVFEA